MRDRRDGAVQGAGAGRDGADGGGERRASGGAAGAVGFLHRGLAARTTACGHRAGSGGDLDDRARAGIAHSLLFYRAVLVLLKTFVEGRWIGSAWSWSARLSFRVVVFGLIPQEKYSFVKRGTSADE